MACRFLSSIESSPLFFHSRPRPEREKVGAVFYIPDFMEIQTPRALPNCPERWRDNLESAGNFSRGEGWLSRYAPAHFFGWVAFSSPQSRMGWEYKTPTSFTKGGSSVLYSGLHGKPSPMGFSKLPGAMAGQPGRHGRFFSRRGMALPLCTCVFSQRSDLVLLPNPVGNGKHKKLPPKKKVGVVFIKAEPIDKAEGKKLKRGWEEHPALCRNHCE